MKTGQVPTSFYPRSAVSTEISVVDPELQRLTDELDHINALVLLDPFRGTLGWPALFDPLVFALSDDEKYLSLYDLCSSDPTRVDAIKESSSALSITSSTTPPLVAATSSPESDCFAFPPSSIGGKWFPTSHPSLVPSSWYVHALPAPAPPTPCPATPDPTPDSCSAGSPRSTRAIENLHHKPYRRAAPVPRRARGGISGKHTGRVETQDYLDAYPSNSEDIVTLHGYRDLVREGHWGPIIADTLRQIGVPYPIKGLRRLLVELYDGEGEQQGWPKGEKGRPVHPWRVSLKNLIS